MNTDFTPIILGTDINVYGVASSFHQEYGINSFAIGMNRQIYTDDLDFLDVYVYDDFDKDEVFVSVLNNFAKRNDLKDKKEKRTHDG